MRLNTIAILFVLLVPVGCSTLSTSNMVQQPVNAYRDRVWAQRAYNLRYSSCQRKYGDDFKRGFIDGYCDVCDGSDGYVPATAPDCYRGFEYQTPEGAKCVNAWFTGYPLGAAAAKQNNAGSFRNVYISKMIKSAVVQENAQHVLPDDVPVVAPDRQATEGVPKQSSQAMQPRIIQSSNFVPSDPNMLVPAWETNAEISGR